MIALEIKILLIAEVDQLKKKKKNWNFSCCLNEKSGQFLYMFFYVFFFFLLSQHKLFLYLKLL